ncbi:MAG: type I-U CRISPR-associated protein Cas5/Cas6 [Phycisphaerales bacterium]|nr:type I-U CRISPR-associated protein Cas5/Cas6 [Phycisphaerales bacterium]
MPSHLHISVTFLQHTCHARLGKEDAAPNEWPPSPLRLFQAMVAGAAARWAGDDGSTRAALTAQAPVAALGWLANLCAATPPTILAPRAVTGQTVPRYVPNNSADLVAAKWSRGDVLAMFEDRTKKVFRPTHLLDGDTVHYLWPLDETSERQARQNEPTIAAAARCIVALGWGIDAAIGDARIIDEPQAARLSGERWEPGRVGTPGLRLPVSNTLDALIDRHAKFLDRLKDGVFHPVPRLRAFSTSAYRRASDVPPRPFAAFALRRLDDPEKSRPFGVENAAKVAAMLRHVACKATQKDRDYWAAVPGGSNMYVAGHTRDDPALTRGPTPPRFSYLPLPSIGSPYADGMIRRVLVAEPHDGDGRHAKWAAMRLAASDLIDEDTGEAVATLERLDPTDRVLRMFTQRSRAWITATPIVLPGYDGLKATKAAKLLSRACDQAGLPSGSVESFEFIGPPAHTGGAGRFFVPKYLRRWPLRWAVLHFTEKVEGPLALGAGRHCGLGALSAIDPRA